MDWIKAVKKQVPVGVVCLLSGLTLGVSAAETDAEWMKARMGVLIEQSRGTLPDGRAVFYADGTRHYNLIFTRGFAYIHQWAGDLIPADEVKGYLDYLLGGQRADGCIPDRVNSAGRAIYSPGGEDSPLADHAVDNAAFLASTVCRYVQETGDLDFFRKHEPALKRGLDFIRRSPTNGLVFNPTDEPQCVYGFTDIVQKTGHLLFSSVLYYDACKQMAEVCEQADCGNPVEYSKRAWFIKDHISVLWDETSGAFFAADEQCRQLDIWGTAFVLHHDLATDEQEKRALDFLVDQVDQYVQKGQIRHLLEPETWDALFVEKPAGVYQNGGYWATPLSWMIPVIERRDPELGQQLLSDCLADFRARGIHEWVYGEKTVLKNYLVSASSVYSLLRDK